MALPQSTISRACRSITDFVGLGLDASTNSIRMMMGLPGDAAPGQSDNDHRVNLFFYRIEPSGFFGDIRSDEIWRLRLHCLITTFGVAEDSVSAGENDLRLLGEVVRLFHEQPVLDPLDLDGEQVRMQVVFNTLGLEEINNLWSTQGDVTYRPSVAYEFSLVPVIPREPYRGSPMVAMTGTEARGRMDARHAAFTGTAQPPEVLARTVDTAWEDWAPAICLVHNSQCAQSLSFALGSTELAAFSPEVWIAGEAGSAVTLLWEVWDSSLGWRREGATLATTADSPVLDPEQVSAATTVSIAMPFTDHSGQAVLYAQRSYTRGSDGATLTVRSNPLLINLYQVTP
ncbi:MAG: DUF4255 domain-containing protein [Desulfuromonadales bacterium]|nr:DUF4255 domain-containing protein [Desulfuromonadales bacterium]